MSIYATRVLIGDDRRDTPGVVGSYLDGNCYYFPGDTTSTIGTAHVPAWCVPGHDDIEDRLDPTELYPVGEWLRIDINAAERATCLIDEAAARALRDDLDRWLALPKLQAVTQ